MDLALFDRMTDARWDLPLWVGLARRVGGPVLELGCGTGRVLEALVGAGVDAWGVERCAARAARARERVGAERVIVGDVATVALPSAALVIVPCNTVSVDPEVFVASAARHLRPGGLLVFDLVVPEGRRWGQPPYTWRRRRGTVEEGGRFDPVTRVHEGWVAAQHVEDVVRTHYPPLSTWPARLRRVGLEGQVRDVSGGPVRGDSSSVVWFATRRVAPSAGRMEASRLEGRDALVGMGDGGGL